jgi:hypothetical protein
MMVIAGVNQALNKSLAQRKHSPRGQAIPGVSMECAPQGAETPLILAGFMYGLNRLRKKDRFEVNSVECAVPGLKPASLLLAFCGG